MRILLTGITGFAGGHLAEALLAGDGAELFGVSRRGEWPVELAHLAGRVTLRGCDLGDATAVDALVREASPEQVYHLAGYAHAGQSFKEPEAAWHDNLHATRNLYQGLDRCGLRPRILYVGSGLVYGDMSAPSACPDEDAVLRPASPYAASKAAADLASYQYTRSPGLAVVRARPFNHIGPRQSPRYAVAHFAQQIAAIEQRRQPPVLETGNLAPVRALADVRDVVRAYVLLMERGRVGEAYNVSGESVAMQEVLDRLLALARVPVEVRQRADLVRGVETAALYGDCRKLCRETGWQRRHSLDDTLADTLDYWRTVS
jgi:GDP-4-dehydro-6-deoxy-D-mannose reductase